MSDSSLKKVPVPVADGPIQKTAVALLVGWLMAVSGPGYVRAALDDGAEGDRKTADRKQKSRESVSEATALAAVKKLGGVVRPRSRDSRGREVAFHLRGRGLTDAGLVHVAALKNIVSLNLRGTKITSKGLVHLKKLKGLQWLHLERTKVGDDGIRHLAGLVNLEYLNLYATKTTDKSLKHLSGLKKLRRLYVWQTGVTEAGAVELQKKLPKLRIVRGLDLSKLPEYSEKEASAPKPKENLKWIEVADADSVPRSQNGLNTQVYFENKSSQPVRLYWKSYGGELKLYATLAPGEIRQQNSYSKSTWVITDAKDRPLGYFIVGVEVSRAVIPKLKGP